MLTLLLVVEASSATTARGLRSLRRLETYLRATMKQERLNHLTVLHVHQDGLQKVKGDFVSANEYRRRVCLATLVKMRNVLGTVVIRLTPDKAC